MLVPNSLGDSIQLIVTEDAQVYSLDPNTNFGTSDSLYCPTPSGYYCYWKTNVPNIPIDNATLFLYKSSAPFSGVLYANKTTSTWTETGVTYNNKPTSDSDVSSNTSFAGIGWYSMNVTDVVIGWANGSITNYGFNLSGTAAGGYWGSKESYLGSAYRGYILANYSVKLLTPENSSVQTKDYPPLTTDINFTWSYSPYYSNIMIAEDSNFTLLILNTTILNNYTVQSLEAGNYWWKVRYYNITTGLYGDSSSVFNFTISSTGGATGQGIQGVVYELIGDLPTPISGAIVYIYNTTWSDYIVTGSNGYYLFSNLANGTYNIYSSKVLYDTTVVLPVTVNGSMVTNDILMKQTEPTDFESNQQYVMFRTRWLWCITDCDIEGLTVTIYKSGEVISYKSGVTDSLGIFKAKLFKSQLYRVTFINSSIGVNQEGTYYGSNPEYVVFITNTGTTFQEHDTQEKDAITIAVSKLIHNSTTANITINFTDSLSQTTALTYYINQSNTSDPVNQTNIASWTWVAGTYNHTFNVFNYSGQSYLVHIVATHTEFGTIDRTYAVMFERTAGVGITNISNTLWLWFAIGIMIFTGAIFTSSTAEKGLLIVCAEGWIFFFMGMFASLGTIQFGVGLTLASVIAVLAYFKKSNASEGYA